MPAADERLRHLFLAGTARTLPFTTPNRGGRRRGPPDRNPDRHGRALAAELSRIVDAQPELIDLRRSYQLEEITGTQVTFELVLNPALSLDSLEDKRAGIELLAFRATGEDIGVAVVFVPDGKLAIFERKLEAYLDPERRRHQPLINSIERIRRTVLEDLWTDPVREFPGNEGPIWWEVWVRNQVGEDRFRSHAERLEIEVGEQALRFPDRTVVLARATVGQMSLSVEILDSIAELREARSLAVELLEIDAQTEVESQGEASHYRFLVAEEDGEVSGYACWGPIPGTQASADLYWIVVDPKHQGKGIGAALLNDAEDWMASAGRTRVYVETSTRAQYEGTRHFYLACGYKLAAELEDFYAPGDGKAVFLKVLS